MLKIEKNQQLQIEICNPSSTELLMNSDQLDQSDLVYIIIENATIAVLSADLHSSWASCLF